MKALQKPTNFFDRLHWYREVCSEPKGALIVLPGRGNSGYRHLRSYQEVLDLEQIACFAITPPIQEGWYPSPNSPQDQAEAVAGQPEAAKTVSRIISIVQECTGLPRRKIVISGFSMGAVAAVYWATRIKKKDEEIGAVICHSGAILEPKKVPKATHNMPILLNHSLDDFCFDWQERYIPSKKALVNRGYNVLASERRNGNHIIMDRDVFAAKRFLEDIWETNLSWEPLWLSV